MAQHQGQWPVSVLCEVMPVSRSGFYSHKQRQAQESRHGATDALLARVRAIAAATRSSYGSRRMAKQLQEDGFAVGRYKAKRLMQHAAGSVRCRQRRVPMPTDSRHGYGIAPNV